MENCRQGHAMTAANTMFEYGSKRCLACKRRNARESARRRRAAWNAEHGSCTAAA
jgi:hypothetical protein